MSAGWEGGLWGEMAGTELTLWLSRCPCVTGPLPAEPRGLQCLLLLVIHEAHRGCAGVWQGLREAEGGEPAPQDREAWATWSWQTDRQTCPGQRDGLPCHTGQVDCFHIPGQRAGHQPCPRTDRWTPPSPLPDSPETHHRQTLPPPVPKAGMCACGQSVPTARAPLGATGDLGHQTGVPTPSMGRGSVSLL